MLNAQRLELLHRGQAQRRVLLKHYVAEEEMFDGWKVHLQVLCVESRWLHALHIASDRSGPLLADIMHRLMSLQVLLNDDRGEYIAGQVGPVSLDHTELIQAGFFTEIGYGR